MASVVLGSTTVISESDGTVTFPTGTFNGKPGTDQIVQHKVSRVYSPYHHHYTSSGGFVDIFTLSVTTPLLSSLTLI